jgi:hypothetical protein
MLSNTRPSNSEPQKNTIPDPWEDTSPTHPGKLWQFQPDAHPLMSPAPEPDVLLGVTERPGILRLKGPKTSSVRVLLQDGLKLKAYAKGQLKNQLEKALALLTWLGEAEPTAIA